MYNPETEENRPYHNLSENKSRLSRRQQIILAAGGVVVATSGAIAAAQASGYFDSDNTPDTSDSTHSLNIENTPTSQPEFTVTTPSGATATFETPSPTPAAELTPTPTSTEHPTPTPEITPSAEHAPYDSLIAKISSSSLSEKEKSEYIGQIEELKQIETVQKQLMSSYSSELGPDGKTPALLHYTRLRYPNTPNLTPESQIFILQNQKIIETIIRPQIQSLNTKFDQFSLKQTLEQISYNAGHVFNPDGGPYLGLNISLSDYPEILDSQNESQITYENLTPDQIAALETVKKELAPLTGNFSITATKDFELNYFQDTGKNFILHINPSNPNSLRHEWAHATNIDQNKAIATSLSPQELVKLATLHEKALTDPQYGRQYATLEQLFSPYSKIDSYTAGASSYPFETFVTNTEVDSQDKIFKIEPHNFATNSQSGEKLTVEEVVKILELKSGQFQSSQEFVNAKLPQLQKLAETSPFYAVFVEMLKKDPSSMDNLATKIGKNSIANFNNHSEGDYTRFFVEYYCDSAFTVALINGQPDVAALFNSLSKEDQKLLLTNSLTLVQHADYETWAEGSRFSVSSPNPSPRTDNPYSEYYEFLQLTQK